MGFFKDKATGAFEAAGYLLEGAVAIGLLSWTTVALAMGQFVLGGVLTAAFIGVLLRLKRGRLARRGSNAPPR